MPTGIYKRIKSKKYGATGKHWKVKNTSKMKGCKNALGIRLQNDNNPDKTDKH